jgi:hypothetical protein
MLTIFTTPKRFKGHNGVIQRNAIKSWAMLKPTPQIIMFGNDEGNAEVAAELKITHVPNPETSEKGTPLISSMFGLAHQMSSNPLLCFINADIMLTDSFIKALQVAHAAKPQFLMTGRRTLFDLDTLWDFDQPDWESALNQKVAREGKLDDYVAMDYFAFPRGVYDNVPPFVVGRARWDNWMVYSALKRHIPVIDATAAVLAIHENHDYSHLKGGLKDCFVSPEGLRNQELYGLNDCIGTADATHYLKNGRLRRALGRESLARRVDILPIFHPILATLAWPLLAPWKYTKPLRRKLTGKSAAPVPAGPSTT